MQKEASRFKNAGTCVLSLFLIVLGCVNPAARSTGSLAISVGDGLSRELSPTLSMEPRSYDVAGAGPNSASFALTLTDGSLSSTVNDLVPGTWQITVTAKNDSGTAIGQGNASADVSASTTGSVSVAVTPFDGTGTLSLQVSWTAAQVKNPEVSACLLPSSGDERSLAFSVDSANGKASFSASDVTTGYQTLTVKLLDGDTLCTGAVEVVRIAKDTSTSGTYAFADINQSPGTLTVSISPAMADPLQVSINGAAATKAAADTLNLTATVGNYSQNVTEVWYINGNAVATGASYSFGSAWPQGAYRIDVTAFTADGARAGSATTQIQVVQNQTAFVSRWQTDKTGTGSSGATQVSLPLVSNGSYDFVVAWGDGTQNRITAFDDAARTHTYAAAGTYEISITGKISGWSFNNTGDAPKLLEIKNWGPLAFGQTDSQFYGCTNLTVSALDSPDLSGTTSLFQAFYNCKSLATIPSINTWNMSGVTNMALTFAGASVFNADLSCWDTSHVTTMQTMFYAASKFNGDISLWNTSGVLFMTGMFYGAPSFNGDISKWNTSNVTNMYAMFYGASSFNCDISGWNTSQVTNMGTMFRDAASFNRSLSRWNTSHVQSMSMMFYYASSFNGDLSGWDTSHVTDMTAMFYYATSFNGNLSSWNISSVTNLSYMFSHVTLSTAKYDALLNSWANQAVHSGLKFDGGYSKYSSAVAAARASLISGHGWTITDGGMAQ